MRITRPRSTMLSQIIIDADLDMGAYSLKVDAIAESAEGAGVTVANAILTYPWNVTKAALKQSLSVSVEESEPRGLRFKPDGTKMYIIGPGNDEINEYDLSTPWDISTATPLRLLDVSGQEASPMDVFFKSDGVKMYVIGALGKEVNEYDLGTPWNISTAAPLQLKDVSGQENTPRGLFFKPDGLKMYIIGGDNEVNEYDLGTPWNVTTAASLQLKDVSGQAPAARGLFFKPDGTKMYVVGSTSREVNEYDLGTPWNVTTATPLQLKDVTDAGDNPSGVVFKPDGTKMYVVAGIAETVSEYNLYCLPCVP